MEIEPIMFPWLIARLSRGGMRCAPREELASGSKREARSPLGMSKFPSGIAVRLRAGKEIGSLEALGLSN